MLSLVVMMLVTVVQGADPSAAELMREGVDDLRQGRVEQSVEKLDRVVELDPDAEPYLWQRGIALYLAGRYADGRAQFESHRTVNPHDVENATWHFLCVAASDGPAAARKAMLPAPGDRRVPMEELYALYRGTGDRAAVDAAVDRLPEGSAARRDARFYADLYLGLLAHAEDRPAEAKKYLEAAGAVPEKSAMADVARLCRDRLVPKDPAPAPPSRLRED